MSFMEKFIDFGDLKIMIGSTIVVNPFVPTKMKIHGYNVKIIFLIENTILMSEMAFKIFLIGTPLI